jgi:hypothetical protein
MAMKDPKLIFSEKDAAKRVDLSGRSLQRLRLNGEGPDYVQLSLRRVGYTPESLARWIASRSRASTSSK